MNQICMVCGEPAAGFHFGAFTCEGCKSFFGRTYNNMSAVAGCKNSGDCIINKQTRTTCKACRLRKCLHIGMSKSGSRYGRRSNWFKIHCLLQGQQTQSNVISSANEKQADIEQAAQMQEQAFRNRTTGYPTSQRTSSSLTQLYDSSLEIQQTVTIKQCNYTNSDAALLSAANDCPKKHWNKNILHLFRSQSEPLRSPYCPSTMATSPSSCSQVSMTHTFYQMHMEKVTAIQEQPIDLSISSHSKYLFATAFAAKDISLAKADTTDNIKATTPSNAPLDLRFDNQN